MNSHIYRALLLYGHENFNLEIIEYCNKEFVIDREQYYIDLLKPEYNILRKAGSSLGFKHSMETLLKFKSRKLSPEALTNLKRSKAKGAHITTIVNSEDNSIIKYNSIRAAAKSIGVCSATILKYSNNSKLLKGIYFITKKSKI